MIIGLSCCFWRCSLIGNELTWKRTRLVSLSASPSSIQTAFLPPPRLLQLPPLPLDSPAQATPLPSCIRPFSVTIHYFDGSHRKKDGGYFDFQTCASEFLYLPLSSSLLLPCFCFPTSFLYFFIYPSLTLSSILIPLSPNLFLHHLCFHPLELSFSFFPPSPTTPTLPPPSVPTLQPLYTPAATCALRLLLALYSFNAGSL